MWVRDGGRCLICIKQLPHTGYECHHRKLRAQGGQDSITNLITLCGSCHRHKVHANPRWAYAEGYLVRSHDDPAFTPVRVGLLAGQFVCLTVTGEYHSPNGGNET